MNPHHSNYNWDGPADQFDSYLPGSLFRRRQNDQQLQFPTISYGYMNSHHMGYSALPSTSTTPSPFDSTNPDEQSEKSTDSKEKTQRWTAREENCLVQLWSDNFTRLESRHARVVWEEISKGVGKSIPQCKRKMQYLKDKYKEAKDHNRNQSGGERRTSPFYDAIDSILGCRDVVTLEHVMDSSSKACTTSSSNEEADKNSEKNLPSTSKGKKPYKQARTPASTSNNDDADDDDDDDGEDFFHFTKSTNKKRERKSRKKSNKDVKRRAINLDDEDEHDDYGKQMNALEKQGDKLNNILESMEKNQSQQLQIMSTFMDNMMKMMNNKSN